VHVSPLLVTNTQSAKLIQPSEGSFHDPAPSAQSAAMLSVSLGEQRHNVAGTQPLPDYFRIVGAVAQYTVGAVARSSSVSL